MNLYSLDQDSQDNEASPRKLANQHRSTNYSEEKLFLLKNTILEACKINNNSLSFRYVLESIQEHWTFRKRVFHFCKWFLFKYYALHTNERWCNFYTFSSYSNSMLCHSSGRKCVDLFLAVSHRTSGAFSKLMNIRTLI